MKIRDGINRREVSAVLDFQIREEGETKKLELKGTPVIYNREAVLYESEHFKWTEIIEAGAAKDALLRAEQVLLWQHNASQPMAARANNTLAVREDNTGVHIEADVSGTQWGRDGFEAIQRGIVNKMSFGFYIKPEGYTDERSVENGKRCIKRTIKKIDRIVDFSPVTYPAYDGTDVSARDADSIITEIEKEEKANRERLDAVNAEFEKIQARAKK